MSDCCFAEDVLQSYLDGELAPEMMSCVGKHLRTCTQCREALAEAEQEHSMFAEALRGDLSVGVPTGQLRARIGEALEREQRRDRQQVAGWPGRVRERLAAVFSPGLFTAPRFAYAGFAALLLVAVAVFGIYVSRQPRDRGGEIAQSSPTPEPGPPAASSPETAAKPSATPEPGKGTTPPPSRQSPNRLPFRIKRDTNPLPGEKAYLETIASLEAAIKKQGDLAMRPNLRFEYERNVAMVDQAIVSTRTMAMQRKSNPQAAEFLFAAYQSKVDLLKAVLDRTQLTASAR